MISLLVAWRTDHGPRERAWTYLEPLWRATGHEVVVRGDDGRGPFNKSLALNRAFADSTGDVVVVMDADGLPPLPEFDTGLSWQPLYARTEYLSPRDTDLVCAAGADPHRLTPESTAWRCSGIVAVRRDCWPGMDERFVGWGGEDLALRWVLEKTHGRPLREEPTGAFRCLWHPGDARAITPGNLHLLDTDYRGDPT